MLQEVKLSEDYNGEDDDDVDDEDEEYENEAEENANGGEHKYDKSELVNSKTINDILKYGATHHSVDSNPGETQSEWSDEDDEAKGEFDR